MWQRATARVYKGCEVSLTVLRGEWGTVHWLAFGWSSALRARHGVCALDTAAKAGAQLQAPHVADYCSGIKGLLWTIRDGNTQTHTLVNLNMKYYILFNIRDNVSLPSICFWQSFSSFAGWLIHVCSCRELFLQQSCKIKPSPFRVCNPDIYQHSNMSYICACDALGFSILFARIIYFHFAESARTDGSSLTTSLFVTFITISVLSMKAIHLSYETCCHCDKHIFVWKRPPAHDLKSPLGPNRLIHIGRLIADSTRLLALVNSGSGLGRHANCSLKLPHFSRALQDASH